MSPARTMVAFFLSLHAVAHAAIALAIPWLGLLVPSLLAAAFVGHYLEIRLQAGLPDRRLGKGSTLHAWSVYALALFAFLAGVVSGDGTLVRSMTQLLILFQLVALALPTLARHGLAVLINAQVLCCAAVLTGGLVAAAAVSGLVVLTVAALAVDHHERLGALPGQALLAALPHACVALLVGGGILVLFPPRPHARVVASAHLEAAIDRRALMDAYFELFAWSLLCLLLVLLAWWFLGRPNEPDEAEGGEEEEEIEDLAPEFRRGRSWRPAAGPPLAEVDVSGARGRIVRAYLALERRLARAGQARRESWTVAEYAERLPDPARRLARLFGLARYGDRPLDDALADEAERAADVTWEAASSRRR